LLNEGVDVDGTYPIEVAGTPLAVYCDMTTDGGGWTQLLDQDVVEGFLPVATWLAGVNQDSANLGQYSILNFLDQFEGDPGFEFFIDWPNDGASFVRWEQTDSPFPAGPGTVTNVVESPANQLGCTLFGGLRNDSSFSTFNGSDTTACEYWAIGTSRQYGRGIPAYADSDGGSLIATRARLWVR
jgi:hypothetical protein